MALGVLALALGLGGVALATPQTGSVSVTVSILDGTKLKLSATTFAAGKLTLVVVNNGKLPHALAIMGNGLEPVRTATLRSGASARLSVTVKTGMYHVWDPVQSSMTHATMLMVRSASSGSSGSGLTGGSTSGSSSGGGATGTGGAADSTDPCAGHMM